MAEIHYPNFQVKAKARPIKPVLRALTLIINEHGHNALESRARDLGYAHVGDYALSCIERDAGLPVGSLGGKPPKEPGSLLPIA